MKKALIFAVIAIIAILTGCRTETTITGKSCYGLSNGEKEKLTVMAKRSLKKNAVITKAEYNRYIKDAEPKIKIDYTGDCFGTAYLTWSLEDKTVTVMFDGDLTEENIMINAILSPVYSDDTVMYQNVPGRKNGLQKL